jgi:hypothetical protein
MTCRHPKRARVRIEAGRLLNDEGISLWLRAPGVLRIASHVVWCADCGALGIRYTGTNRMRWRKVGCP